MDVTIRELGPGDAAAYREVRLEGLKLHPRAFGASWAEETVMGLEAFAARLEGGRTFGAHQGDRLVGVTTLVVPPGEKVRHKGMVVGVYVRPEARGGGVGRALLEAALGAAAGAVEIVQLGVDEQNAPARRLYESLGFRPYGLELRAYKLEGDYVDDLLMWRPAPDRT